MTGISDQVIAAERHYCWITSIIYYQLKMVELSQNIVTNFITLD